MMMNPFRIERHRRLPPQFLRAPAIGGIIRADRINSKEFASGTIFQTGSAVGRIVLPLFANPAALRNTDGPPEGGGAV
jgi:hypothetical protein